MTGVDDIKLSDFIFKVLISSSLPQSWDTFTEMYIGRHLGIKDTNLKKAITSQQFIGIIKEEYACRESHNKWEETTNMVTSGNSLANCMTPSRAPKPQNNANCRQCGKQGHDMQSCIYLGKNKCIKCNKFHAAQECWKCNTCDKYGHRAKDCWKNGKKKHKHSNQSSGGGNVNKVCKQESASIAVIKENTNVTIVKSQMTFNVQTKGAMLLSRMEGVEVHLKDFCHSRAFETTLNALNALNDRSI